MDSMRRHWPRSKRPPCFQKNLTRHSKNSAWRILNYSKPVASSLQPVAMTELCILLQATSYRLQASSYGFTQKHQVENNFLQKDGDSDPCDGGRFCGEDEKVAGTGSCRTRLCGRGALGLKAARRHGRRRAPRARAGTTRQNVFRRHNER